jgi:lysyl-tRNA synthetase class 2
MPDDDVLSFAPTESTDDPFAARRAKIDALRAAGIEPYRDSFSATHHAAELSSEFASLEAGSESPAIASVAGRLIARRDQGKAAFLVIRDATGDLQLFCRQNILGDEEFEAVTSLDLGDWIGATGQILRTRRGELSVSPTEIVLLSKSMRPLPEKFHGLTDTETRYRQRYVDLIVNPESRETFVKRSKLVQAIREFFVARGYLEVETPMMHPIPGGAAAKPFMTHHNALDMDLYLRIAPELYLKKLVVGGLEKVFEINRNFRNEGISTRHNPEFTMIEFYEAYRDFRYLMDLTETLLRECAQKVAGTTSLAYQGETIDLAKPFDRLTMAEAIAKYNPRHPLADLAKPEYLKVALAPHEVEVFPTDGLGLLQLKLFEATTESKLVQPTFIVSHPTDVSPLARANDADPAVTDRFELFITGREMANGFSELNDPEDQAARFAAQAKAKEAGDEEAMYYDADYVRALEYGLPPTAGEGIGIDRLVMLFTDSPSIRDVILFPQLKAADS